MQRAAHRVQAVRREGRLAHWPAARRRAPPTPMPLACPERSTPGAAVARARPAALDGSAACSALADAGWPVGCALQGDGKGGGGRERRAGRGGSRGGGAGGGRGKVQDAPIAATGDSAKALLQQLCTKLKIKPPAFTVRLAPVRAACLRLERARA